MTVRTSPRQVARGTNDSPRARRGRRLGAVALTCAALLGACGGGGGETKATKINAIDPSVLPPTMMGMRVAREDVTKIVKSSSQPYVTEMGLFSFRKEDLLQATLQISRFSDEAQWETTSFRRTVAQQILGSSSQLVDYRMGTHRLFLGGNARQTLAVWFDGPYMMVMSARIDFGEPRGLLRRLVELEIGGGLER